MNDGSYEIVDKELPYDKKYILPDLTYVDYDNIILAIAGNYGKWLVLNNKNQYSVLEQIKSKKSIGEIIESNYYSIDDIISVLTQIEGKRFDIPQKNASLIKENLIIHLTNQCNLKCPHCYMKSGSKMVNELTTHEVIELSRNFKSIGGKSITLTGGEPTLRKDLFEIVDFLNSLDIDVLLLSNGYQWNETTINQISKKKIKEIQFSIDGFDEETNSLIRGKGAFTNCMNNVDHLCKLGKRVSIAITPPYNILKNSQTKYIDFVKQLLSKYHNSVKIFFTQSLMSGRYLKEKDLDVFHNEYKEIIKQIVREINPNFEKESFVSKVKDSLNSVCGYGNLVVLSNGDYYFCDNIPKSKLIGNIRNKTFYQIFNEMNEAEKKLQYR